MAPRRKADEKASANGAADLVLHYLRKQNRPYSAIDVSANLHNKVTKAAAAKVLKELHEQKQIEGRSAGKQIVYHAIQDPAASCTPDQLTALDTQTTDLRNQTVQLAATAKMLRSSLSALTSELSTAELLASVAALESERVEIRTRLESLKQGKAKKVTQEQREEVEREWVRCARVARKREKIARSCWGFVEDMVQDGERREELRESLGLDD